MNLITGRNTPAFAKDMVYRFMKMIQINWLRITTIHSSRIIKDAVVPLDSEDRANILIIDDSMFERNCSKEVCKSYLNLSKECNSLSYDAITAHTAVIFTRYMMLSLERRESNDIR